MIDSLLNIEKFALKLSYKLTNQKHWEIKLTLLLLIFMLLTSFPNIEFVLNGDEQIRLFWEARFIQSETPFTPLPADLTEVSHINKMAFRFFVPMLVGVLGGSWLWFPVIQLLATAFLIYFSILILKKQNLNNHSVVFAVCSFACIFPFKWGLYDISNCFDIVVMTLMAASLLSRNFYVLIISIFSAFWIDERALIAAGFVFIYKQYRSQKNQSIKDLILNPFSFTFFILYLGYFSIRIFLFQNFGLTTGLSEVGLQVIRDNFKVLPMGLFSTFEFWSLVFVLALIAIYKTNKLLSILTLLSLVFCIGISFVVYDISRSMAYCLPLLFISTAVLSKEFSIQNFRRLMLIVCILCFLFPTHIVSIDITWLSPIFPKIIKML